jgi:hypothetical protein
LASKPVRANSDGYTLAIASDRGAFERIVGNVDTKNIVFGLTDNVTLHDTDPIKPDRRLYP